MGTWVPIIINLVTGAVGGNLGGAIFKKLSLGTVGNSLAGIVGGGLGGWVLNLLGMSGGGEGTLDVMNVVQSIVSGGVGGTLVMAIVGFIKQATGTPKS